MAVWHHFAFFNRRRKPVLSYEFEKSNCPCSTAESWCTAQSEFKYNAKMQPLFLQDDPTGDVHMLKPGSNIPAEGDLRKLLTPDMWCAHESMALGQARLKETGLKHIPTLAQIHPDHLRLAFEQLPLSAVSYLTCFCGVQHAVYSTPLKMLMLEVCSYCQSLGWELWEAYTSVQTVLLRLAWVD